MEEKKLTDEEIVKALECKVGGCMICESVNVGCPYDMKSYCDHEKHLKDILDLIHRLQSENKELRTESDKMVAEHLAFVELSKKANEQQKAEISELKAQCSKSSYRDSWKNKFFKAQEEIERLKDEKEEIKLFNLAIQNGEVDMRIESEIAKSFYNSIVQVFEQNGAKNFFTTTIDIEGKKGRYAFTIEKVGGQTVAEKLAEQKAEIERLTEEKNIFWKKYTDTYDENAKLSMILNQRSHEKSELQKQVDELKQDLENWKKAAYGYKYAEEQAVKDTAKEILDDLRNTFIEQSSYGCDANQHIGYYDYVVKIGLVIEQVEEYAKLKYGIEYGVEVE